MYSGVISVTDLDILQVLRLAQTLMLDPVVLRCEQVLMQLIDFSNFVEKYFIALKYNLSNLQEKVVEFVKVNITVIIERAELLGLEPQDFKTFITEGLMSALKQEVKFSLIISWVGQSVPDREKYLLHLFGQVVWTSAVNELLVQINCTQNIFTTNEFCLFQLLQSLVTSQAHQLGPFLTTYPRLYSVYSHMLDDLVDPKIFHSASRFPLDSSPVSVDVRYEKDLSKGKPAMKEIGVNTEDCLEEQTEVEDNAEDDPFTESRENSLETDENEKPNAFHSDTTNDTNADIVNNVDSGAGNNTKHRRKSLPRKITIKNADKESKEKKTCRKQRKGAGKSVKDSKTNNFQKKTTNVSDESIKRDKENEKNGEDPTIGNFLDLEKEGRTLEYILKEYEGDDVDINSEFTDDIDTVAVKSGCGHGDDEHSVGGLEVKDDNSEVDENDKLKTKLSKNFKRRRGRPTGSRNKKQDKAVKVPEKGENAKIKKLPKMHESELPKLHCTYENCYFTSRTADFLEKHVERVHMQGVELKCHKCPFTTKDMKTLCHHVKTHYSNTLPYKCETEGCSMTFMRIGLFIRHQMAHMQLKPYKCDLCDKHFVVYNQLSTHKKLHEGWYSYI